MYFAPPNLKTWLRAWLHLRYRSNWSDEATLLGLQQHDPPEQQLRWVSQNTFPDHVCPVWNKPIRSWASNAIRSLADTSFTKHRHNNWLATPLWLCQKPQARDSSRPRERPETSWSNTSKNGRSNLLLNNWAWQDSVTNHITKSQRHPSRHRRCLRDSRGCRQILQKRHMPCQLKCYSCIKVLRRQTLSAGKRNNSRHIATSAFHENLCCIKNGGLGYAMR